MVDTNDMPHTHLLVSEYKNLGKRRVFTLVDDEHNTRGRFYGKTPKQAACKAFSRISKLNNQPADELVYFVIRECTRELMHRRDFLYSGRKEIYTTPLNIVINRNTNRQKTITFTPLKI